MDAHPTLYKDRFVAGRLMMNSIIVGNEHATKLALAANLIGRGFLLTGDPGFGKTALALALQKFYRGATSHVTTCTPQLKPSDVTGQEIRNPVTGEREKDPVTGKFRVDLRKPMLVNIHLVDEINRGTADFQAALLWLTENGGAWIGDQWFPLPEPYFFLGTRNYQTDPGTHPMIGPLLNRMAGEAELLMPSRVQLRDLIRNTDVHRGIFNVQPGVELEEVLPIREFITHMVKSISDPVADYLIELVLLVYTRKPDEFNRLDLMPRENDRTKQLRRLRFGQKRLSAEELKGLPYSKVRELEVLVRGVSPRVMIWGAHLAAALAFIEGRDKIDFSDIEEAWCAQTHQLLMRPVARSYGIEPIHILTAALDLAER